MRVHGDVLRPIGLLLGLLVAASACGGGKGSSATGGNGTGGEGASSGGTAGNGGNGNGGNGNGGGQTGGNGGGLPDTCAGLEPLVEPPEQLYVAPDGDDAAAGTKDAPLASVVEAASRFPTGGTVIVRGGVYGPQHMDATGLPDHPLVIRAATGETPIFDGSSLSDMWDAVIVLYTAENVVLQGLEIRNCTAPQCGGIDSVPVSNLTVRECHIHHVQSSAARFMGKKIRILGNHFHDIALTNVDNIDFPDGGWPTCTGTAPDRDKPDTPHADDVEIRDNRIENCWGEGIGVWFASNAIIEGNVIDNPFNVGIYMDNAFGITVSRNFVQVNRGIHGGHGSGILMGTEPYVSWGLVPASSHDISITNNVVVGGGGIGWWSSNDATDANRYENVAILHNTVVATNSQAIGFDDVNGGAPAPSGCSAVNNILSEIDDSNVGSAAAAWSFAENAWLNNGKPSVAGDTDVTVNASLGTVTTAGDVQPLASVAGAGQAGTGVAVDYVCKPRDPAAPTRGAFEP